MTTTLNRYEKFFRLESSSIYLIKEFDNQAVFPGQSGRFNPSQIDPYYTYEVHGDPLHVSTAASSQAASQENVSPFGAYPVPASTPLSAQPVKYFARGQPCASKVSKTIVLVTLQGPGNGDKPSTSKLTYNVVTQIQVSIDVNDCSPSVVAREVSESVGFDVILLDSKCYPLLDNAATSVVSFWRSTRKILAASKSIFQKVSGGSVDLKRARDEIDLTQTDEDEELSPPSKRLCATTATKTLDDVFVKVEKIESKFTFISAFLLRLWNVLFVRE